MYARICSRKCSLTAISGKRPKDSLRVQQRQQRQQQQQHNEAIVRDRIALLKEAYLIVGVVDASRTPWLS